MESTLISKSASASESQFVRMGASKYTLQSKQTSIFEAISSFDINKLMSILSKVGVQDSLNITTLTDDSGHTLIHRAAYDNTVRISEYLLLYYKQRLSAHLREKEASRLGGDTKPEALGPDAVESIKKQVRQMVAEWINTPSRSEEGFYPMHFASFHGNVKLIKLLHKNGADIRVRNKQGINMLHVAAQGDQPYSLTYFREKGLGINSTDDEQSTPLHWACFAGSDTASYYLQSWGCKVNA